jgi:hypothetical protein
MLAAATGGGSVVSVDVAPYDLVVSLCPFG